MSFCNQCAHVAHYLITSSQCAHPTVCDTVTRKPLYACARMRAIGSTCGPQGLLYAPAHVRDPVDDAIGINASTLRRVFAKLSGVNEYGE